MSDPLQFLVDEMRSLDELGLKIRLRTMGSPADAWMVVDGQRVLNFCTNNYLGLANHPRMKEAAKAAIDQWGVGPAAVRSIAGTQELHLTLEQTAGRLQGRGGRPLRPVRLLRQPGGHRPAGRQRGRDLHRPAEPRLDHRRLPPVRRPDRRSMSTATRLTVKLKVRENLAQYRRGMLITDGVFSMDGDVAPLDELYRGGRRGTASSPWWTTPTARASWAVAAVALWTNSGLHGKIDVEVGTLSKAFGVVGGVIAGRKAGHRLPASARATVPVLQRGDAGRHRRLPGRRGHPGRVHRAGGQALAEYELLQGRDEAPGL